jgi:hypothetical protein
VRVGLRLAWAGGDNGIGESLWGDWVARVCVLLRFAWGSVNSVGSVGKGSVGEGSVGEDSVGEDSVGEGSVGEGSGGGNCGEEDWVEGSFVG